MKTHNAFLWTTPTHVYLDLSVLPVEKRLRTIWNYFPAGTTISLQRQETFTSRHKAIQQLKEWEEEFRDLKPVEYLNLKISSIPLSLTTKIIEE